MDCQRDDRNPRRVGPRLGTRSKARHQMKLTIAMLGAIVLLAASCGSSETPPVLGSGANPPAAGLDIEDILEDPQGAVDELTNALGVDIEDLLEDPQGAVDALTEDLVAQQNSQGAGSARLVVGDQEWTFSAVLCAFGPDEIGQEGAEFVLSSVEGGLQMYVSIDDFGQFISLDDIADFENPAVGLGSSGNVTINIDGKTITAEADFIDGTAADSTPIPGSFEATCP